MSIKVLSFFIITWIYFPISNAFSQTIKKTIEQNENRNNIQITKVKAKQKASLPQPPFPNGLCGGEKIIIQSSDINDSKSSFLPEWMESTTTQMFLPPRTIEIWLPSTYINNSKSHHPVLYVHDGQNAIEDSNSWTGSSWRLAGALTRLYERDLLVEPISTHENVNALPIVVLIPSSEGDLLPFLRRRHLEYADMTNVIARAHTDFVGLRLKPFVDHNFRTLKEKECTFAMGTSLGGQASMNLLLRYSDLFGGIACLSPYFQPGTFMSVMSGLVGESILKDKRIYMDNGGDVDDSKVPFFDLMDHMTQEHWWNPGYWWLDTQLQPSVDMMRMALNVLKERHILDFEWHRVPGARHNERAWAWRIEKPLLFLFGDRKHL